MKEFVLIAGGIYGGLAVILGAFGAHGLKKHLNPEQLKSFETGVKYQMYHALMLVLSGITFPFIGTTQLVMAWSFILGTFLFSFSIYVLVLSAARKRKWKFIGPVTPLGGFLLLLGWVFFSISIAEIAPFL